VKYDFTVVYVKATITMTKDPSHRREDSYDRTWAREDEETVVMERAVSETYGPILVVRVKKTNLYESSKVQEHADSLLSRDWDWYLVLEGWCETVEVRNSNFKIGNGENAVREKFMLFWAIISDTKKKD